MLNSILAESSLALDLQDTRKGPNGFKLPLGTPSHLLVEILAVSECLNPVSPNTSVSSAQTLNHALRADSWDCSKMKAARI